MAEVAKIQVETRDPGKNKGTGTRVARRLRAQGRIPAIIYGHKQTPVPISLSRDSVWEMIKKSTHLAELNLGGPTKIALGPAAQGAYLGKEFITFDSAGATPAEPLRTEARSDFRGPAPATPEGAV